MHPPQVRNHGSRAITTVRRAAGGPWWRDGGGLWPTSPRGLCPNLQELGPAGARILQHNLHPRTLRTPRTPHKGRGAR